MVATVLYIVALPLLLLLALKKKYKTSLPARFFLWRNDPLKSDGIWIHSCSFGEARALAPLVTQIPSQLLRLSTTTYTGYDAICKYTQQSRYLPYEIFLPFWIKPQKLLLVMEAELWYMLFVVAGSKGARRVLINARMSERSYPKYMRVKWLYQKIFSQIDAVYAQTQSDKEKLESLGATNITVTGNIKFIDIPKPSEILQKPIGTLVCAGSTHEHEESLILQAFMKLKSVETDAKLIVVPRHPERFDKVDKLLGVYAKQEQLSYLKYSQNSSLLSDIILVDALGKLINIYAISDVVILGGAFEPIGGHNAAEAAQFGCKIISGEHYFNQRDIFAGIDGIDIASQEQLGEHLLKHKNLPHTKLINQGDISPILREIRKAYL